MIPKKLGGQVKEWHIVFRLFMGMSRHLRFVPEGGGLVEVTCRTIQGRFLLRPSQQLNDIILGVLGRAQERHPLEIVCFSFLASHFHLLLRVPDAQLLSQFMGYFSGNLAREVARLMDGQGLVQPLPVHPHQ
jgi:REP element-mobilizing transposase RayT